MTSLCSKKCSRSEYRPRIVEFHKFQIRVGLDLGSGRAIPKFEIWEIAGSIYTLAFNAGSIYTLAFNAGSIYTLAFNAGSI